MTHGQSGVITNAGPLPAMRTRKLALSTSTIFIAAGESTRSIHGPTEPERRAEAVPAFDDRMQPEQADGRPVPRLDRDVEVDPVGPTEAADRADAVALIVLDAEADRPLGDDLGHEDRDRDLGHPRAEEIGRAVELIKAAVLHEGVEQPHGDAAGEGRAEFHDVVQARACGAGPRAEAHLEVHTVTLHRIAE